MATMLKNQTNNKIANAIYLASKDKTGSSLSAIFQNTVTFLHRRHLLSKAPAILSQLENIINDKEGRVVVKIKSAKPLAPHFKKELIIVLKKRYEAEEINLVESLDEKLLGGIRIEVKDEVIDLTIKNKITKLQEYLTRE